MPRKLPQRTCLGCHAVRTKKEMIRIVRTSEGSVEVDPTGKKSGRGAYVCPNVQCVEALGKGKRLERVLDVAVPPSFFEQLLIRVGEINPEPKR